MFAQQRGGGLGAPVPPSGATVQLGQLKLPAGFSIAVYADNVAGARSMALGPDGTVFVGTQRGNVFAVVDRNGDHRSDEVITIASDLTQPNGVAFRDGALYVAEISRITRYDGALDFTKQPAGAAAALKTTVVTDKLPTDRPHGWKYLGFGPDGLLYTQIGAPGNLVDRGDPYATIVRMKPDGSAFEIFARGVRNSVGLAWHPDTRELWFTDNGRDMLGDEVPNDELNVAAKPGMHFGYPYCHEGTILDPEFGKGKSCADYAPPAAKLGPHVAALGLKFYSGSMFPAEYRKQLFIVNHGSWNRSAQVSHTGYRVMLAKLQNNTVVSYEPFVEGWLQGGRQAWGRPVDLLELPDGSLLVSDDRASVLYRITS
ncbi:MAG: sorbosone dehydrogenase family protein [Luteitalea sp.]|nr:sorbosone dehydrogenase family protein [Luteitalea sp.]